MRGQSGRGQWVEPLQEHDPTEIGGYRLLGRLGAGGMGQVYLGESQTGDLAAIKVVHPGYAHDPSFRARFAREVEAARRVDAAWTASVVDADPGASLPWLATAYVPGPSLEQAINTAGPLPESSLRTLALDLAQALAGIHAAGLVHRDLKPSNVLLAPDGPRVIDFGISRATDGTRMTATGMVVGTPGFMSPEQAQGHEMGPASDVFSFGAVLVFAATGRGPFGQATPAVLLRRVTDDPPDLSGVPDRLWDLLARCLAKDPTWRPTAAQIAQLLGGQHPVPTRDHWLPQPVTALVEQARLDAARLHATVTGAPVTGEPGSPTGRETYQAAPVPVDSGRRPAWLRRRGVVLAAVAALGVAGIAGVPVVDHMLRPATPTGAAPVLGQNPQQARAPQGPAAGRILASGFGQRNEYAWVTALVENTSKGVDQFVTAQFNLFDASGTLLASDSHVERVRSLGQQMAVGTQVKVPEGAKVARIEATLGIKDYGRPSSPPFPKIPTGPVRITPKPGSDQVTVSFEITNPTAEPLESPRIGLICYDASDQIIGGHSTYPNLVPGSGKALVQMDPITNGIPARCTAYAGPS